MTNCLLQGHLNISSSTCSNCTLVVVEYISKG